jgi:long-chain acyl-CoA synthetase
MDTRPWQRFYRPGTRPSIDVPRVPLFTLLDNRARIDPDLIALAFFGQQLTYAELVDRVNRMANALLALGLARGDRVMLMLPNCPAYVIAYYGALKAGGIIAQVNPLYVEREVEHLARDCGARFMVVADLLYPRVRAIAARTSLQHIVIAPLGGEAVFDDGMPRLDELLAAQSSTAPDVGVNADDIAVLQYTGGTTGLPKGAMLSHFNLVANVLQCVEGGELPEPGETRILTILPLFHSFGMTCCMNLGLHLGARIVLLPRFDIDHVMRAIKHHQITNFPGVPTMYVAVLNYPNAEDYGISSIKSISSGGAAMPVEVADTFEHKFGAQMGEGYGLSEASPVTHSNPSWDRNLRRRGSIGIPITSTDARIVDLETGTRVLGVDAAGELCIAGPQVMQGYWDQPDETALALRDGWLYTGDIARMDADGYFYILDRKKEMIVVGGYNVYPREIEEVLYEHPAVLEAAVIGVPDAYKGELPKAFVALAAGASAAPDELIAFCRQRLAPFKVPRSVEVRESLPHSAVGKILRRELAAESASASMRPAAVGELSEKSERA